MKKNPLQAFRRFFVRTRKYNTTAARPAAQLGYEDDDNNTRLSGAFIIVLLLHIIAVVGVFAFARIKESRKMSTPPEPSAQTAASKTGAARPAAAKQPNAALAGQANAKPSVPPGETIKTLQTGVHSMHIVKDGETLTKIAFAYNVGVPELLVANRLKNQDDIRAGQPLTIPETKQTPKAPAVTDNKALSATSQKGTPAATQRTATPVPAKRTTKTYVVQTGDSAVKIARDHGCSYEELVKLNKIKDPKKIQPGQILKLPVKNG